MTKEKPPSAATLSGQMGGHRMYTDYGYTKDGIEFATLYEAYDDD